VVPSALRRLGVVALAAALPIALAGCGSGDGGHHAGPGKASGAVELVGTTSTVRPDPAAAGPLAGSEKDFAIALVHQLNDGGAANVSASPASLDLALSMLANGARGTTRSQIQHVLQAGDSTNAGWQALTAAWDSAATNGSFALSTANAAWLQKGFPVEAAFLTALKRYYATGVWTVDFAKSMPAALAALNAWTADHTNGKITKLFDTLDPATALVLADAVHFKAAWETQFDPRDTASAPFTLSTGRTVPAKFMNDTGSYRSAIGSDYDAVELPYRGGRFAALAVMPTHTSLHDFTAALSASQLDAITGSLTSQGIALSVPKFTTSSTLNLKQTLSAMGMPLAFGERADFSAMTSRPVAVGQVIQRVYLAVAEKGTEAAAATGAAIGATAIAAPPLRITLDHPFLFLIRDTSTGAILFASRIADPTAG